MYATGVVIWAYVSDSSVTEMPGYMFALKSGGYWCLSVAYASIAVAIVRMSALARATFERTCDSSRLGIAISARIARMATTTRISTRVNARVESIRFIAQPRW